MPTLTYTQTPHATITIYRQLTKSALTQGIPTTATTLVQATAYKSTQCAYPTPIVIHTT